MHKKLSINALSNLARYVVHICILFLLTPFVINKLGSANYGLWVVVLSLVGYSGLLEMGVQTSVVKLVAQYSGAGDTRRLNQIVAAALTFFVTVGIIAALATWFVVPLFLERMVSDPSDRETVRILLVVLGFNLIMIFPNYVFSGVVFGMQAFHRKNLVDVGCALVNAFITYVLLNKGYGLIAIITAKVITDLLTVINTLVLCMRTCPHLRPDFRHLSKDSFRELFVMGGKVFSSATMSRLANNAEPLIISGFLGTTWTAIYSIPKRLMDYVKEISWTLTSGFMPMFSELQAKNELDKIRTVYFQYTRYIQIFLSPVLVAIIVHGTPFIRLWVGEDFAQKGQYLIYLLAASFFVEGLQPLAWRMLIGVGKVNFLVKVSTIGSLTYVIAGMILVSFMGINGIALSALTIACVNQILYFTTTSNYLEVSVARQLKECQLWPTLVAALFMMELLLFSFLRPPVSYLDIAAQILIGLPLYALITYFLVLQRVERRFLTSKFRELLTVQSA